MTPNDPSFRTSVWLIRPDGSAAHQVTRDGFDVEPVFSPDGTEIAFRRISGTQGGSQVEAVEIVKTDGSHVREAVPPRAGLEHPDWSPNGTLVSFNARPSDHTAAGSGSVLAVHPSGRGLRVLRSATDRFRFFKPVWAPDGTKILVGCNDQHTHVDLLCTMTAGGHKVRIAVDDSPVHVNYPAWGSHAAANDPPPSHSRS